jgi:hypothetical protein
MVQRGEGTGLPIEAGQPLGVLRNRRRQDLDGDLAVEVRVGRPVHLAHSTFAKLVDDAIRTESISRLHRGLVLASVDAPKLAHRSSARATAGPPTPIRAVIS